MAARVCPARHEGKLGLMCRRINLFAYDKIAALFIGTHMKNDRKFIVDPERYFSPSRKQDRTEFVQFIGRLAIIFH
jgi:hypothetical protein